LYLAIYWWGAYTLIIKSNFNFQLKSPNKESIILIIAIVRIMVAVLIIVLNSFVAMKKNMSRERGSPFECGFDPKSSARLPFSLHFFLVAVIFLIFDVEIALLMPIPMLSRRIELTSWTALSVTFIIILILGTVHEWVEGSLE